MPDLEVNHGLTARDWAPARFWIQAGLHNPNIVLARFDFAYDPEEAEEAMGRNPSQLFAVIDAHEAAIEDAGVIQHSHTAPGDGHTILARRRSATHLRIRGRRRRTETARR